MSIVSNILELFGEVNEQSVVENFCLYEAKYNCKSSSLDMLNENKSDLESLLKKLAQAGVGLIITINTPETVRILSTNLASLNDRIVSIVDQLSYVSSDEEIEIELRIDKEPCEKFNVFNFEVFVTYLNSLTLEESLTAWSKFDLCSSLIINVWCDISHFSTESISFISVYPTIQKSSSLMFSSLCKEDRINRLEKRDKCGHFANASQFSFIPNDFKVSISGYEILERYFNGLYNSFLIVYLSDFSSINKNDLSYRLKGYKLLSESINFGDLIEHNSQELASIYDWTFSEGNYTDKIGLARNIISIHLENECLLSIEYGTADSVQSGYDLYLKDNVKQYIEIKNKISDFIQGQSDKALEMTKSMFSMFKTGLWTFTTFFITVFLLRVVNKGTIEGAFSFEVFIVSMLLITISFLYLLISVIEINSDRDRLLERYHDIRSRYKDLLNKNDLDKILDIEKVSSKEKEYINKKRNSYIFVWVLTNITIFIVVCVLYYYSLNQSNNIDNVKNKENDVSELVSSVNRKIDNKNLLIKNKVAKDENIVVDK